MTDQPKPEPRIDSDNIERCVVTCPRHGHCVGASVILTCGRGICEPWAHEAAVALRAMEAVRRLAEGRRVYIERDRGWDHWHVTFGSLEFAAADLSDAILKAAEAAKEDP